MKLTASVSASLLLSTLIHARISPLVPAFSPRPEPARTLLAPPMAAPHDTEIKVRYPHHNLRRGSLEAIFIVFAVIVLVTFTLFTHWIYRRRSMRQAKLNSNSDSNKINATVGHALEYSKTAVSGDMLPLLEYSVLDAATSNFGECNILGEGGFSRVYKAVFHGNALAAVKRIDHGGPDSEKEFENEMDMMSKIQHRNILSLLGYCIHGETRFIISEFMEKGSLEMQLHGPSGGSLLSWHTRMKIALDIARGLEYLHEHCDPPIIHRDIKSSNILLDSRFNAKISDFGLSVKVGCLNKSDIMLSGTLGYVAPEYLLDGKLTEKSDVYAFGIVLLELLMGRKPIEKLTPSQCQSIVTWAMPQLTDRSKLPTILDPVIKSTMDLKHLYQVAAVAILCVQPEPSYRPLITDVLHSLIPLVPVQLGGTLKFAPRVSSGRPKSAH